MGRLTEKPNRYPIFLKTDTEYRTDFYKNRPKKRKAVYVVPGGSTEDIHRLLLRSLPKTCSLDPLLTNVLLESVDILLPYICAMCNASLREDCLPASQKSAVVTPVM